MIKYYIPRSFLKIRAIQWTGDNRDEISEFIGDGDPINSTVKEAYEHFNKIHGDATIWLYSTVNGPFPVRLKDYIYRDITGSLCALGCHEFEEKFKEAD